MEHGPLYSEGCRAVGGRVLLLGRGGTRATAELTSSVRDNGTLAFSAATETVLVHTAAVTTAAGVTHPAQSVALQSQADFAATLRLLHLAGTT